MKQVLFLILVSICVVAGAEPVENFVVGDHASKFNLELNRATGKVHVKSLGRNEELLESLKVNLHFANHQSTEVTLKPISLYTLKDRASGQRSVAGGGPQSPPDFEGYLGPSSAPLVSFELSVKNKNGLFRDLRWRFEDAYKRGDRF